MMSLGLAPFEVALDQLFESGLDFGLVFVVPLLEPLGIVVDNGGQIAAGYWWRHEHFSSAKKPAKCEEQKIDHLHVHGSSAFPCEFFDNLVETFRKPEGEPVELKLVLIAHDVTDVTGFAEKLQVGTCFLGGRDVYCRVTSATSQMHRRQW